MVVVDAGVERSHRAERRKSQTLANRNCDRCGHPAEAMLIWGGQQVAIRKRPIMSLFVCKISLGFMLS